MQYPYRLDDFMEYLYEENQENGRELLEARGEEFRVLREKKREELKRRLGLDRLEKLEVREDPVLLETEERENFRIEEWGVQILPRLTVPFYVLVPGTPRPGKAILYCHGHGEGGVRDCFVKRDPPAYHKCMPMLLAEQGYTVYLGEPAGFGDFRMERYHGGNGNCYPLATQLLLYGMTAVGLRVYETLRLAGLMEARGVGRYAAVGISGGGHVASLCAALDDRMAAAVVSGYGNLFKTCIMAMDHCIDNFVPDIFSVGEMPWLISLAVPKPLYLASGLQDPIFPAEGTRKAVEIVGGVYAAQGCSDNFRWELFEGGHEFSPGFLGWLEEVL